MQFLGKQVFFCFNQRLLKLTIFEMFSNGGKSKKLYAQAHYQLYLLFFPLLALYVNDVQNPEGSTFKISIKTPQIKTIFSCSFVNV